MENSAVFNKAPGKGARRKRSHSSSARTPRGPFRAQAGLLLAACITGCATEGYFADRARDAADVVTFTVGAGWGAKARAGPLNPGLLLSLDLIGLRAGQGFSSPSNAQPDGQPGQAGQVSAGSGFPRGAEVTTPLPVLDTLMHYEAPRPGTHSVEVVCLFDDRRAKDYYAYGRYVPFVTYPERACPAYWTQIEAAAGFFVVFRAGFNPGELVDFLLGWTTVDLYGDDRSDGEEET